MSAMHPLVGVRVLEYPGTIGSAFCARTLASLGADVVTAGEGPPGVDRSVREWLAIGKRAAGGPVDPGSFDVLVGDHRTVINAAANGSLVVVAVTPFGLDGPRAGWRSSALVQCAMAGWMNLTGSPNGEPMSIGGLLAETLPGLAAATGAMAALRHRDRTGQGQVVEVSAQEVNIHVLPYQTVGVAYGRADRRRSGMPFPMTIAPGADGFLGINVLTQPHWEALCHFAGLSHLIEDPALATPMLRAAKSAELTAVFRDWASRQPTVETFHAGQEWRIPLGYVPRLSDVASMPPHVERRFFRSATVGDATVAVPGTPFLIDGVRPEPATPGQAPEHSAGRSSEGGLANRTALEGLRMVDLTAFWAGPLTTMLCAWLGADVVKVESIQHIDGWRGLGAGAGERGWEESPLHNGVNINKRGITLDLGSPDGRDLLLRLVANADALVENYSTRVMRNFGLTDEVLFAANPKLVILSMPGFGMTGPWSEYVSFAPTVEQLSGLPQLTGDPEGPPVLSGISLADPAGGLTGGVALLAALRERDARGSGVRVDLSQLESLTTLLGHAFVDFGFNADEPSRSGNRVPGSAPSGCYRAAGDDDWVVLEAGDDADWRALCAVTGHPEWLADRRFASPESRWEHRVAIDALVTSWASTRSKFEAADAFQAAGVTAAPVLRATDLMADPHLAARGYYVDLDHEVVGRQPYPGPAFRLSRTPAVYTRAAPTVGQHNGEVLGGELGLNAADLARLEAARVIGTTPLVTR